MRGSAERDILSGDGADDLYSTVQYSTVQYSTVLYSAVHRGAASQLQVQVPGAQLCLPQVGAADSPR